MSSLVPRPSKTGGGEGLVHTVCTCALISPNFQGKHYTLVLLRVTITYDDKQMFGILLTAKVRSQFN